MPSACRVACASRPSTRATAAAAPSVPIDEVQCQPRSMIVTRIHHVAQPALELESDDVGIEQCDRRRLRELACGEERGHEHTARMSERHEAHVVVVERMRGHAVGERRESGARVERCSEDTALAGTFLCCE